MSKKNHKHSDGEAVTTATKASGASTSGTGSAVAPISREDYHAQLHVLQVELVKLQRHFIGCGDRILVLLEGRDAAGKDGGIKRIVEYLSPRETRVVALGKPSDRERKAWYFQRYVAQLPVAEEFVLFNRSWYNRAGVEHVMGFCSKEEHEEFMQSVPKFEEMLVNSGVKLLKYYLDIGKAEQTKRLAERQRDPLKQWKSSPIDAVAVKHWKAYSDARDGMLQRTHTAIAPWYVIRTDNKRLARLNLIRDMLSRLHYEGKKSKLVQPDPDIAFEFTPDCIFAKRLAR
ncbi:MULTISPECIES: polyphosphate kinase 2 [Polaromonas]|uniref:ADP/GDP-polyphosphate phosphotransferase n=1 Tax=Polaromonas aquatica TaxID=332657 RepID=A0ABW1TYW5_9BURK